MNPNCFKPILISTLLLLIFCWNSASLYAQIINIDNTTSTETIQFPSFYSLPPKIHSMNTEGGFGTNEKMTPDALEEFLVAENAFRNLAKTMELTNAGKTYGSWHFYDLIDTVVFDLIEDTIKTSLPATKIDSLVSILEDYKIMQEIIEKINTVQNFYGSYFFMDSTNFHKYGPGSYSFKDTTFNLTELGNYGIHSIDSTFIQPRLNEITDIYLRIAANVITGYKLWQKTHNSRWFDDYIGRSLSLVDSVFHKKEVSKKIDAYFLIGDLCLKYGEAFYPPEYLTHNPLALEAYLKAYNLASLNESNEKMGLTEFKISTFYNPKWHNNILDKSLGHLKNAIKNYSKGNSSDSYLLSLMWAKRMNLECMKIFREGGMLETEKIDLIRELTKGKKHLNKENDEIKYYYYQALGFYFSSTGLKSDLEIAKTYFQAALFYALQNWKNNNPIAQQIKITINYLFWIYGNLNLEFEAINLYDLVFEYAETKNDMKYLKELQFLESYIWYNLRNKGEAQESFMFVDTFMKNNQLVYDPSIRDEIESLITIDAQLDENPHGVFTSNSKNIDMILKFSNYIERQAFRELSNLNSLEYKYQIQLLEDTKLKVEKQKKNLRIYAFVVVGFVLLAAAVIIRFAILTIKKLKKKKIESDKKAAISQVLARCMSHNIGSHALSKFMDERVILKTENPKQYVTVFTDSLSHTSRDNKTEREELIANFNAYLKYRMDFLADIATTSQPFMESPMYFGRDLFKGLDKNRILLNRISGVSSDVSFGFKIFVNDKEIKTDKSEHDKKVSIPNDVLGAQAFYIILENIIRNIYKHGNPPKKDNKKKNETDVAIEIHLNESKTDKSVYEISVFDTNYKPKNDIDKIVSDRNKTFNEDILSSSGKDERLKDKLRSTNLGTIEMAACAAYLKGWPVEKLEENDVDNVDPRNTVIYAYTHTDGSTNSENNNSLGYRFYLNKPKEVLVVSEKDFQLTGEKDELQNLGIRVEMPAELNNDQNFNHQFIYFDEGINPQDLNRATLPKRVVNYNGTIRRDTARNFIEDVWEKHVKSLKNDYSTISVKNEEYEFKFARSSDITNNEMKVDIGNHDGGWENRICDYYEMKCSHSLVERFIFDDLFCTFSDNKTLQYEYIESVLTKVLILDDRIQKEIVVDKKKYANRVPFQEYFKQQFIYVPEKKEVDLNAEDFGNIKEEESEAAKTRNYITQHIRNVDFYVIHLGILERLAKSSEKNLQELISILFPEPAQRNKLVITSGRGGLLNIESDIRFLPFSMLQNAIVTQFDKSLLVKLLYNSRKNL
jgi:hypothetical protein